MSAPGPSVVELFQHGLDHHRTGDLQNAEAAYRQTLARDPAHADALNMLGMIAHQVGRDDLAIDYVSQAIRIQNANPLYHNNLGLALEALGRIEAAEEAYRNAMRLRPDVPEFGCNLANALSQLRRWSEAVEVYHDALRIRPDLVEAHNNLGSALNELGKFDEAEENCRAALRLKPDLAEAHGNLGNALRGLNRLSEAEFSIRAEVRFKPDSAEAHNHLGIILQELGRPAEAQASYRTAIRLKPDIADVHCQLAFALLLTGQFDEGWREHEWRLKAKTAKAISFGAPRWGGEPIGSRTLLLHGEQGFGDTIQFARYAARLACETKVVLGVQAPLARLMSSLRGDVTVVGSGDLLPPFDLECPLMSLPGLLGTRLETIPADTPYLWADPALAANWRECLASIEGLRVGLVWAGGWRADQPQLHAMDDRRSMSFQTMAPIADIAGVAYVSLQLGERGSQAASPPEGMVVYDFTEELADFADTAALIDNLDLVISVDTAVAHLAGALGKPVWLLNWFDTDWRWLLGRSDSPWYPTLRQFRQPKPGDWASVISDVRSSLAQLAEGR